MLKAGPGAVFVWCNDRTGYPKRLAAHLGRNDLIICPFDMERVQVLMRGHQGEIVLDHAAWSTQSPTEFLEMTNLLVFHSRRMARMSRPDVPTNQISVNTEET